MYSSEELERFYFQYQTEALPHGESLQSFCVKNKVPYNIFQKWYKVFVYLIFPNVEKNLECTLAHNTSFFASLPRVKTFSGKEIINNWVVSRHFEDNKRQIRDLP